MASTTHVDTHHGEKVDLLYGVCAEFESADDLIHAAAKAREAGFTEMDAYSPFPIHGLDEAMGFRDTRVPYMILGGGIVGALVGLGLQSYVNMVDYPLNVGNRPLFSWPSFIPVTYECTILLASLTAVFGTLALCGFPKPYHPIFNMKNFARASQDGFFLCLEKRNKDFDAEAAERFLQGLNPKHVERVMQDEEGSF